MAHATTVTPGEAAGTKATTLAEGSSNTEGLTVIAALLGVALATAGGGDGSNTGTTTTTSTIAAK